jgi:hypothetical protein
MPQQSGEFRRATLGTFGERHQAEASCIRVFANKLTEDLAKWAQRGRTQREPKENPGN